MILKSFFFPFGPLEVNLFILADENSRRALLIDAGVHDSSVEAYLRDRDLTLEAVLITHLHRDHIDALTRYRELTAQGRVISPSPVEAAPEAEIVKPGDQVRAAGFEFQIFQTSGHTPESISYYCPAWNLCFVGDALFAGAVGGTSDDRHHAEEIELIQRYLMPLPGETRIFSGHGPATKVQIEKEANPFLQPGFTRLP